MYDQRGVNHLASGGDQSNDRRRVPSAPMPERPALDDRLREDEVAGLIHPERGPHRLEGLERDLGLAPQVAGRIGGEVRAERDAFLEVALVEESLPGHSDGGGARLMSAPASRCKASLDRIAAGHGSEASHPRPSGSPRLRKPFLYMTRASHCPRSVSRSTDPDDSSRHVKRPLEPVQRRGQERIGRLPRAEGAQVTIVKSDVRAWASRWNHR